MLIASFKPGHDGSVAVLRDEELLLSFEGEKDSYPRYDNLNVETLLRFFQSTDHVPDVICHSGWPKGFHSRDLHQQGAGYFGIGTQLVERSVFGKKVKYFASTHERSHLWGAYGMSPFPQGRPVHCLIYEGNIGRFYSIDEDLSVTVHPTVLNDPGNKYSFLFSLADPTAPVGKGHFRFANAGKLMALSAYGSDLPPDEEERRVIDWILAADDIVLQHDKAELKDTKFFNCGVESQIFKDLARKFSDSLLGRFLNYATRFAADRRPLLIAGGCGLNCDWNRKWVDSGLFTEVFVPPVTNDSGSAIGTAVDAQRELTGSAKIRWDVYSGIDIQSEPDRRLQWEPLNVDRVARDLHAQKVVAVMRGRCEIGPRALGARSLLASPFDAAMVSRLNRIKSREGYRPIAPIVLEERALDFFDLHFASPYMLYFAKVTDARLRAVTHVDGSARPQTVNRNQNAFLCELLEAFERLAGVPVLCNTSLNFAGRGFINSEGDLANYCLETGIDRIISQDRYGYVQ